MARDTRSRMIDAAVEQLRQHGVAGMSFTQVLEASGAARGAIYHHFPEGKSQLVAEAAAAYAADVREHLAQLPASSPSRVVRAFLAAVRPVVEVSAGGGGCAVAAVSVAGGPEEPRLRAVAAGAFDSWIEQLAERLQTAGLAPRRAADLATTLIATLEGAHLLCRASGDLAPFDHAARTLVRLALDAEAAVKKG